MTGRVPRFAALMTLLAAGLAFAADTTSEGPQPPVSARDVQDLIILGDTRPVLVRLHITIDGKPYLDACDEFVQTLFKQCDKDGDGCLNQEEAEKAPSPQALLSGSYFGQETKGQLRTLDKDRDGKVSLKEFTGYYRDQGGAFQLQFRAGQAGQADTLNDAFFKHLDTNGDGKLSREELATAPNALVKFDTDDDEVLSAQELTGRPAQTGVVVVGDEPPAMTPKPSSIRTIHAMDPNDTAMAWRHDLVSKYGTSSKKLKDKRLTREDIGLDEETFKRLDADKDGELDREELTRFADRPADVELIVRLGKRGVTEPMFDTFQGDKPAPMNGSVRKTKGSLYLDVGNSLVELRGSDLGDFQNKFIKMNTRQIYVQQFKAADMDNNGYVDAEEAARNPAFNALFKALDSDGDGKVFEKDLLAQLDRTIDLQTQAASSRALLTVVDQGKGLFDLFDVNHDGRLTVRELKTAADIVAAVDRDKDGLLGEKEIPRTYQLTMSREVSQGSRFGRRVVAVIARAQPGAPGAEPTKGPLWFRKMDRNADGDVSAREFLGTPEDFKKIDADSDGLISFDEAEKFDAVSRKEKAAGR